MLESTLFWYITLCNPLKADIRLEELDPIFKIEDQATQETGVKQAARLLT
jgi:hypothetical protein